MTLPKFYSPISAREIIKHSENEVYYEGPPPSMLPLSRDVTFEDTTHSPLNIGGADYHAPYTHVATEDQHVPYRLMNTSDADYDNDDQLDDSENMWDNMTDPTPPFEKPTQGIWDPTQEFYVGLLFADKDELQAAVKHYHIKRNQTYCVKESNPTCWFVRCKHCSWHLRACFQATHGLFEVRKYNDPYTCTESMLTQDHEQLDTHVIEKDLRDVVKNDPTIKISSLQQTLYNKFQYRPSYFKVWEAKEKAIGRMFGDWDKSYQLLPKWLKVLTDSNPGSRVIWRTMPATMPGCAILDRVAWTFGPSIEGFQHCRLVISIDGTFLYCKYRGTLLIALSWDGDNRLFPLAFPSNRCNN
ncbi:hypothetical protein SO802_003279 [Lithocarpus litseifolius]|uniref:Transposase MuDR plant domain-containing protein n=1 Tax=Lithocarpus litseifolius TaxID=425828 RepID=A0AAW2E3Q8_9ROSI